MYDGKRFSELVNKFMVREVSIMSAKSGEYTEGEDKLQGFRDVAGMQHLGMSQVALCYLLKHIQSIAIAVKTGKYQWAWETEQGEGLKQRIADARNYLLLLAACLDEESDERGSVG